MIASLIAGLLLALGGPPRNHWFAAVIGLAVLFRATDQPDPKRRLLRGWLAAFVMFLIGLAWTKQFSFPGWFLLSAFEALFYGVGVAFVPAGRRGRNLAFPAALTLAELLRTQVPFGGLPMGGFTLGQVNGPLASSAAVVGELGLVFVVALVAVTISEFLRIDPRRWTAGWVSLMVAVLPVFSGASVKPRTDGRLRVATVQAGGKQAIPRDSQQPAKVFAAHFVETQHVNDPVDLILWPENIIEVKDVSIDQSLASAAMASLARTHSASVAVGVVEEPGNKRFHNLVVVWGPDGAITGRYEKIRRVPFGEYVPARPFLAHIVNLSDVPYDAFTGHHPGVLDVAGHRVGITVSYEALFSRQARQAVRSGGEALVVPTNAASYKSPDVARTQVQAARLRAIETRRAVVQAAPTGISLFVDSRGHVLAHSAVGKPAVLQGTVLLSHTSTPYVHWGDTPLTIASLFMLALGWRRARRPRRAGRSQGWVSRFEGVSARPRYR